MALLAHHAQEAVFERAAVPERRAQSPARRTSTCTDLRSHPR
jgi:hypothetical protein